MSSQKVKNNDRISAGIKKCPVCGEAIAVEVEH